MQRRAFVARHRRERRLGIETLAGKDHAGADRRAACSTPKHHAEAMIQRHRNAQTIFGGERHRFRRIARIVDDVEMGERRALGRAGGTAGELDIDGVVRIERGGKPVQAAAMARTGQRQQLREQARAAGMRSIVKHDDVLELRQLRRLQSACFAIDLRRDRAQHLDIVARAMPARHDQRFAADLVERVFELGRAIGRIDVDQNGADARGAELGVKPLGAIWRPDADPVAAPDAERQAARRRRRSSARANRTRTAKVRSRRRSRRYDRHAWRTPDPAIAEWSCI